MQYSQEEYNSLLAVCNSYKNDYNNAFERLKAQQREIDRLKTDNQILKETLRRGEGISQNNVGDIVNKVRKETAKKIFDYFDKYAGTGKKLIGNMISEQRKKYNVGVEE